MGRLEELLIGREVAGRYRVEALLGRGGMGAVYRAKDDRLQRSVALKVLSPPVAITTGANLRARFRREAQAAASIRHPCVVTVYDYGTDAELDLDFLVMELLVGEDLATMLSRPSRPTLGGTLAILHQVATGLAAGHRRGIVHRDVKPANILLLAEGQGIPEVKVLDFGIAQDWSRAGTITRLTEFGHVPLTPLYASPEQAAGRAVLTPASDVYSLGMTALAMFSPAEPRNRLLDGEPAPLRNEAVPLAVKSVLARALHPDPTQRFSDGSALAEALEGLRSEAKVSPHAPAPGLSSRPRPAGAHLDDLPVPAPAVATRPFARRRPRRRFRTPVPTIIGVVAIGGIGGALLFLNGPGTSARREELEEVGSDSAQSPVVPAVVAQQLLPPQRPWPSLTREEQQHVAVQQREGIDEVEALLRLSVESGATCEFGGDKEACDRHREIEAYLEKRGLLRLPEVEEQERVISENLSLVQAIQDARISMRILHPTLHVRPEASLEGYAARAFVRDGNLYKAVADYRLEMPGGIVRVVEEFYYDAGGQLVYVRRRTSTDDPGPVSDEMYHLRGGVLVQASWNGQPSPRSGSGLQLDALLVHRRGVVIRQAVQAGRDKILISIDDLYPFAD
jgi:hypothetical protein